MRKVHCDYCGRRAEYVDSKVIYGKSYGMIYLCRNCMAYVGVHKGSDKPLGRLANAQLRHWKKEAHAAFDPPLEVWQVQAPPKCRLCVVGGADGLARGKDPYRNVRCRSV